MRRVGGGVGASRVAWIARGVGFFNDGGRADRRVVWDDATVVKDERTRKCMVYGVFQHTLALSCASRRSCA